MIAFQAKKSFAAQGSYRVGKGGFNSLKTYGKQSYEQRCQPGQRKDPPIQIGAERVIFQPLFHEKPAKRPGDQIRDKYQFQEIYTEHENNSGNRSAQNFPNADL